ncbi:hypothetical protein [Rathayibacter iranicus]|uniref:Uncharacterized protein n=2 Tax=Rathayibacter iranicus TaxID=59737 RepID=A0AAD1AFN0_9MICO|nr:hypothetical protein [Rathayibacter iranicus]AZZ56135.1 hypothetical protein C7V51_09760 [Rathayibacter iranicus]MWV30169.1 hypothetical protein [Rathayibacter iranicus NCPPB 2253 = VKM Ac-1602]PPI46203.1 hypothetical protein C5E09_08755 [Rathayibacter iranicus]PPI59577.1 hypothetical protein C5E08_09675 [Rathayibacter iranicus]PPI71055.1 hypothetical protein C5E01_08720 [Rathayibacter iranicus]
MTALDMRPASPVAGTVTITTRSLERAAVAIVHEELGVEVSAIRVRLSDDRGGLALAVTAPVVLEQETGDSLLDRLHRDRSRIASRMQVLTGRTVTRVDVRVTGTRTRTTRRVA